MKANKYFEKHFSKLRTEALVRSLLAAMIIGFVAAFVTALATWFTKLNGLWISLAVFAAVTMVAAGIFYVKKYRPTAMKSARRLDRLGMEERLVTMVEYENDDSIIAQLQRQDAQKKLDELNAAAVKIKVEKKTLATLTVSGVLGIAMIVVTALSAYGLLPHGWEVLEELTQEEQIKYVSVSYEAEDGGYIEGDAEQLIPIGGNSTTVVAVADDGFEFQGWEDGYRKPSRSDGKIEEDVVYIAIFIPLDENDGDGDDAQETQDSDQEKPKDKPQQNGKPKDNDPNAPPSNSGGGKYEEANQVIDGETYYKEVLETYRELLEERLKTEGDQMSEEERAIIEAYLGIV